MKSVGYSYCSLKEDTGALIKSITDKWLIGIRESNPAILDMFKERDIKPYRRFSAWSGEFAGKYITGAAYIYRITRDKALYDYVIKFIDEFVSLQADDGYLGCFSKDCRLTGVMPLEPGKPPRNWDAWSHYHCMYGLLLWYDITGNEEYFRCVERAAQLFLDKFYGKNPPLISIGSAETNLAVYHVFANLYRRTGKEEYLAFARYVEKDVESEGAGQYLKYALEGLPYYQCPKPRWESLHIILGYGEMYRITSDEKYKNALSQIFYSILETDVHNTGAFSTDEKATGNPYTNGNIETCCVVAYNALAIETFFLTRDVRILDFLERSHYNAVLGYYSPSGRWSTYHTPMEGVKEANFHTIGFQCRAGSPELNCCSVNAPRGVASVSDWFITEDKENLYLNFYGDMEVNTHRGERITVLGGYPSSGKVSVTVSGFVRPINLRIPSWAKATVEVNGETYIPKSGSYFEISPLSESIEIKIDFGFIPYLEKGGGDYEGKSCVYVGPILYGLDAADNNLSDEAPEIIPLEYITSAMPQKQGDGSIKIILPDGRVLKDFYHLGVSGSWYTTWLPIE